MKDEIKTFFEYRFPGYKIKWFNAVNSRVAIVKFSGRRRGKKNIACAYIGGEFYRFVVVGETRTVYVEKEENDKHNA